MTLGQHCEGDLFDLILTSHQQSFSYVEGDLFDLILTSHQQSFSYVGTGLPGLNRY